MFRFNTIIFKEFIFTLKLWVIVELKVMLDPRAPVLEPHHRKKFIFVSGTPVLRIEFSLYKRCYECVLSVTDKNLSCETNRQHDFYSISHQDRFYMISFYIRRHARIETHI